ncbi:UNVERIFIED_CONTAM: hypothetical protein FKN15_067301 [Acipenser sinensis]
MDPPEGHTMPQGDQETALTCLKAEKWCFAVGKVGHKAPDQPPPWQEGELLVPKKGRSGGAKKAKKQASAPEWEKPECPQPKRGESVRPQSRRGRGKRQQQQQPQQQQEEVGDDGWEVYVINLVAELCHGCGAYGHTFAICPMQYEEGERVHPAPRRGSASIQRPEGGSPCILHPEGESPCIQRPEGGSPCIQRPEGGSPCIQRPEGGSP